MKNNWLVWLQEVEDNIMCRHDIPPQRLPDTFERAAWLAWSGGRDSLDFSEEYARERYLEP